MNKIGFSGYEDVSLDLRARVKYLVENNVTYQTDYGMGSNFVDGPAFEEELMIALAQTRVSSIISAGTYDAVFELVEIFLDTAKTLGAARWDEIRGKFEKAFSAAGSVYEISSLGTVELRLAEDEAKSITTVRAALGEGNLIEEYDEAVKALIARSKPSKDIVKAFHVVLEGYLKKLSGKNDYGDSVNQLVSSKTISSETKKVLDTLNQFRSSRFGATHPGTGAVPDEIDALWYLGTMVAQIHYIQRRHQERNNSTTTP